MQDFQSGWRGRKFAQTQYHGCPRRKEPAPGTSCRGGAGESLPKYGITDVRDGKNPLPRLPVGAARAKVCPSTASWMSATERTRSRDFHVYADSIIPAQEAKDVIKTVGYSAVIKSFFRPERPMKSAFCYVRSRPAKGKTAPRRVNRIMDHNMKQ